MNSLFDLIPSPVSKHDWVPEAPPPLDDRVKEIELDCETNGLRWWAGDRPIGIAIRLPNGKAQYLPWGHAGGNLDEGQVKRWAQRELRGKRITNLNTRFDVHMLYQWGVDLEAQGCEVSDVAHYAALLDDHRRYLSLESIGQDYLGRGKVQANLDKTRMAEYHAGFAQEYACGDVLLVHDLKEKMWPKMTAEDLHRVRALEDQVIFVVCEMERNGAKIDVELLTRWLTESQKALEKCLWDIFNEVGFKVNPGSVANKVRLFKHLGLPLTLTPDGTPSFTNEILKIYEAEHTAVRNLRRAARLASLRSKYLIPYSRKVDANGILRYALHQLRAQKDEWDESDGSGTVSGRFSSTALNDEEGVNIQQVLKVAKQRILFGYDEGDESHDDELFLIRQLFIPEEGEHLSADAMQIEYRTFASYAGTPSVVEAYKKDPLTSFHKFVWGLVKEHKALPYRAQKDLNFAKLYGAGLTKMALMLEFITKEEFLELKAQKARRTHPKLRETLEVDRIYNRVLPEVAPLLKKASDLAASRGYVRTILGRRMRFPNKARLHKALNGVIQGTAADINKQKLVELHRERRTTGFKMRFTVHDEVDGDNRRGPEGKKMIADILDSQSFNLRVPILWDVATGKNWKECK